MQNKDNLKGRVMLFIARFVVYFILIFLAVLCLFSFYVLIINSSPKIGEVARSDGGARCAFKANLW